MKNHRKFKDEQNKKTDAKRKLKTTKKKINLKHTERQPKIKKLDYFEEE